MDDPVEISPRAVLRWIKGEPGDPDGAAGVTTRATIVGLLCLLAAMLLVGFACEHLEVRLRHPAAEGEMPDPDDPRVIARLSHLAVSDASLEEFAEVALRQELGDQRVRVAEFDARPWVRAAGPSALFYELRGELAKTLDAYAPSYLHGGYHSRFMLQLHSTPMGLSLRRLWVGGKPVREGTLGLYIEAQADRVLRQPPR